MTKMKRRHQYKRETRGGFELSSSKQRRCKRLSFLSEHWSVYQFISILIHERILDVVSLCDSGPKYKGAGLAVVGIFTQLVRTDNFSRDHDEMQIWMDTYDKKQPWSLNWGCTDKPINEVLLKRFMRHQLV